MSSPGDESSERLLAETARRAQAYLDGLAERRVAAPAAALEGLAAFDEALPEATGDALETLALLDDVGSPATTASAGGRFFGFVVGSALPVTIAANWLATAWDQNAGLHQLSPTATYLERVTGRWLAELMGFPIDAAVGYVTGATMANLAGLAAARHAVLARAGWDVESKGLFDAPTVRVLVGEEVHASVEKALALLGLGKDRVERVPTDDQGRMLPGELPGMDASTILCIQAGNVNTGTFDDASELMPRAHEAGAWVHVDGAFGAWAAVSPEHAHLAAGIGAADSLSLDAHKWLNVPYDSGLVLCRHPRDLRAAMRARAPYLAGDHEPSEFTPGMSRRARGVEVWAALRTLGRAGLAQLVQRSCSQAKRFAQGLEQGGYQVLNRVELNQVLVDFGGDERTDRTIAAIVADGTAWCSGTTWQGRRAMRISVSSWRTTAEDVERSIEAMLRCARATAAV